VRSNHLRNPRPRSLAVAWPIEGAFGLTSCGCGFLQKPEAQPKARGCGKSNSPKLLSHSAFAKAAHTLLLAALEKKNYPHCHSLQRKTLCSFPLLSVPARTQGQRTTGEAAMASGAPKFPWTAAGAAPTAADRRSPSPPWRIPLRKAQASSVAGQGSAPSPPGESRCGRPQARSASRRGTGELRRCEPATAPLTIGVWRAPPPAPVPSLRPRRRSTPASAPNLGGLRPLRRCSTAGPVGARKHAGGHLLPSLPRRGLARAVSLPSRELLIHGRTTSAGSTMTPAGMGAGATPAGMAAGATPALGSIPNTAATSSISAWRALTRGRRRSYLCMTCGAML
jgi:hypothetical protein